MDDTARGLSELARVRQMTGGDGPGIAFNWDAYNAKKKSAAAAKIPWAQRGGAVTGAGSAGKPMDGAGIVSGSRPEDRTLSPDGTKLHVVATAKDGTKAQHEFTKQGDNWVHHAGSSFGKVKTGAHESAADHILKSGAYTKTN